MVSSAVLTRQDAAQVCVEVLDEVLSLGDYHMALKLARTHAFLADADTDLLLCAALSACPDSARTWMLVARLKDKVLAARLVLQNLPHWHVDVCVDLLFYSQCQLLRLKAGAGSADAARAPTPASTAAAEEIDELLGEVSHRLPRMRVYAQMLARCLRTLHGDEAGRHPQEAGRVTNRWQFWQDIEAETTHNPTAVVGALTQAREFALARRWAVLHDVSEAEIDQNYLLSLLLTGDTVRAHQVFESLPAATAAPVCDYLLERLEGLDNILFVVRFLLRSAPSLPPYRQHELRELTMGCTALLVLPERMRPAYSHLRGHPHRVLEQLIMNRHVDLAARVLQQFPSSERSRLIRLDGPSATDISAVRSARPQEDATARRVPGAGVQGKGAVPVAEIQVDLVMFYARQALQFPSRSRSSSQISSGTGALAARQRAHAHRLNVSTTSQGRQQQTATNWISDQDAKRCTCCGDEFTYGCWLISAVIAVYLSLSSLSPWISRCAALL